MPSGRLQHLHGAIIELELGLERDPSTVTGKGIYEAHDPDLGEALRILVRDPCGDFEILLSESNWSGCIEASSLPGCDYRISLASCATC